jgi:very-short-patch-repair endonuclease
MRLHNLRWLKTRRRQLRRGLTPTEACLWTQLKKGSRLNGRKFRRQHSVGQYVLDFYCPAEKLAVELDGTTVMWRSAMIGFETSSCGNQGYAYCDFRTAT